MWSDTPRHPRAVTAETCTDVQRELDRPGPPDPGGGGPPDRPDRPGDDPDPEDPLGGDRCVDFPNTPGCPGFCENNPGFPGCGTVTTQGVVCIPLYGLWFCIPLAPPPGGGDGRDGNGWELTTSATASPGAIYVE